jgi:polyhydroxyalkanoate synthesis regulator phasin
VIKVEKERNQMEELKKIFLAGVGLTSTSVEKAEKLINEMVEKGRVTVQEGKDLQSELKRKITDKRPVQKDELDHLDYASKEEVAALEVKLDELGKKLDQLLEK